MPGAHTGFMHYEVPTPTVGVLTLLQQNIGPVDAVPDSDTVVYVDDMATVFWRSAWSDMADQAFKPAGGSAARASSGRGPGRDATAPAPSSR